MKPEAANRTIYDETANACFDLRVRVTLCSDGYIINMPSWFDFLSLMWHVYADCSRDARGVALTSPLRVRLLDYKAETMVFYDAEVKGIRYKSLVRYGQA